MATTAAASNPLRIGHSNYSWIKTARNDAVHRFPSEGALRKKQPLLPQILELESRLAPSVTIVGTKTVDLSTANPGDTLTYTVAIADTGDTDALGVQYLDTVDANTNFVPNSVLASPMAIKQSFNSVGNTPLSGSLTTGVHDIDGVTADAALVYSGSGTSSAGGAFTVNANGTFTYTPQTGDEGINDTFVYTVTDTDNLASTGTVTITPVRASGTWTAPPPPRAPTACSRIPSRP